jgi:hypothetical protein
MTIEDELNIATLDNSTNEGTGIDQMGYINGPKNSSLPLSRDLQFFFVNGIKIPKEYLMDIDYDTVRLVVNMNTISNLSILGYDSKLLALFEELGLTYSNLDKVYEAHDKAGINILTNTYTTVSNTKASMEKEITDHALINEIVRYYYGHVNYGKPFRYDYDDSVYAEVDSAGNVIIDVMDATSENNVWKSNQT